MSNKKCLLFIDVKIISDLDISCTRFSIFPIWQLSRWPIRLALSEEGWLTINCLSPAERILDANISPISPDPTSKQVDFDSTPNKSLATLTAAAEIDTGRRLISVSIKTCFATSSDFKTN